MADEPTLGEVMRQVQALVVRLERLSSEVGSDYVRRDLHDERFKSLHRRLDDVEREADEREKARVAFQRQILGGITVGVVMLLAQTAMTVVLILGGLK